MAGVGYGRQVAKKNFADVFLQKGLSLTSQWVNFSPGQFHRFFQVMLACLGSLRYRCNQPSAWIEVLDLPDFEGPLDPFLSLFFVVVQTNDVSAQFYYASY